MALFKIKIPLITKIIIIVVILVGLLGIITGYILSKNAGDVLYKTEEERLSTLLSEQTHEIVIILKSADELIQKVSELPEVVSYLENPTNTSQRNRIVDDFKAFSLGQEVLNMYLIDTKGKTVLSIDPLFQDKDYSFRDYFKEAMASKSGAYWAIGVSTRTPGFYFSKPVLGTNNTVVGVAVLKIDAQRLSNSLTQSYLSSTGYLMMVDKNGVIIHSNKPNSLYKSLGPISEKIRRDYIINETYFEKDILPMQYTVLQDLINKETKNALVSEFDEEDNINELLGISQVDEYPFYLVAERDLNEITKGISSILSSVIYLVVTTIVIVSLFELLIIRSFLKPLNRLNQYTERVADGNLDEDLVVKKTGDEIESLSEGIKNMVLSLRESRSGLEKKIADKTSELEKILTGVEEQNKQLSEARSAMLNVLEDLDVEKKNISNEKNRIETILASIAEGVFVTDVYGKTTMLNKVAKEMCGYSANEVLGKPYREVFNLSSEDKTDEQYLDFVAEAVKTGNPSKSLSKIILKTKTGKEIPVTISASALKDSNQAIFGCVVAVRDNTAERTLDKSKDEFLSVASHQLRTPLGGMRWNLEMIQNGDYGTLPPEAKEVIDVIHSGSLKMIDLVNDLLNVSRIDQGRVMDEPVETDLATIVKDVVTSLTPIASRDGVKIGLEIANDIPKVVIDPKRFNEVAINLISNSVKYHVQNGEVNISLMMENDFIKMVVSDNGIGIPVKDMNRVFDKFFRAGNAAKSETEGSGLGLYICKKFVEGWGGKITVESEEGKGTKFTVLLPKEIRNIKTI